MRSTGSPGSRGTLPLGRPCYTIALLRPTPEFSCLLLTDTPSAVSSGPSPALLLHHLIYHSGGIISRRVTRSTTLSPPLGTAVPESHSRRLLRRGNCSTAARSPCVSSHRTPFSTSRPRQFRATVPASFSTDENDLGDHISLDCPYLITAPLTKLNPILNSRSSSYTVTTKLDIYHAPLPLRLRLVRLLTAPPSLPQASLTHPRPSPRPRSFPRQRPPPPPLPI
jgi:hypothetical protein